jgi:hypothetical protein
MIKQVQGAPIRQTWVDTADVSFMYLRQFGSDRSEFEFSGPIRFIEGPLR